jgi:large subunit ribosomal protein L23
MKNPNDIILGPILTEKITSLGESQGKYAFRVRKDSNKKEIGKSVEELFKVKVDKVNTITMRGKKKRVRFRIGMTPDWKKAIVTLKKGQKIELT